MRTIVIRRHFGWMGLLAAVTAGASPPTVPDLNSTDSARQPAPETINVAELPLPPTAPTLSDGTIIEGGCTNATGCISPADTAMDEGPAYTSDGKHVLLTIVFAGAPSGSIYNGEQLIAIKTHGGDTFSNGDAWKCITCGVPAQNEVGIGAAGMGLDHPQPFFDRKRVVLGTNILDCGTYVVTDDGCTPDTVHIYPIWWQATADGSGASGSMRELRLSPDNQTLGWSSLQFVNGGITEYAFVARLQFDSAPTGGTPLTPRYELSGVQTLLDIDPSVQTFVVDKKDPTRLDFNATVPDIGELRTFSSDGREVIGISDPAESARNDVFAIDLATGRERRVTQTEYTDPIAFSPDDCWFVDLDVHVSGRLDFTSAMRYLPPAIDKLTQPTVAALRNNGNRRFFQPMLLDRFGQRGNYVGQQLNAGNDAAGSGGISDPDWNARANPTWSPDGTNIVFWQALVTSPACGGSNPLPCPVSTEPGGRHTRLMIAHLASRRPLRPATSVPQPQSVGSWTTPYVAGSPFPIRPLPPIGTFTLQGPIRGTASVTFAANGSGTALAQVSINYSSYVGFPCRVISGSQDVSVVSQTVYGSTLSWDSAVQETGCQHGSMLTAGSDGTQGPMTIADFGTLQATGALTTIIDSTVYTQPANGT